MDWFLKFKTNLTDHEVNLILPKYAAHKLVYEMLTRVVTLSYLGIGSIATKSSAAVGS